MNTQGIRTKTPKKPLVLLALFGLIFQMVLAPIAPAPAQAAVTSTGTNLIKNGSFETDPYANWGIWKGTGATRTITLYRSYEPAFGQGSYSAGIEASGSPESRMSAGLVGSASNSFTLSADKKYLLKYYAKASQGMTVTSYLEDAASFSAVTPLTEQSISTQWQERSVIFSPAAGTSGSGLVVFAFGDMPAGATLYLDGLVLADFNPQLSTAEVKGSIGESNKVLKIKNLSFTSESDIAIELPYYNELTRTAGTKRFTADKVSAADAYFKMAEQTFAGIGRVYVKDNYAGQFNYNVQPKLFEFFPSLLRSGEDLTVKTSGINPLNDATFVLIQTVNSQNKKSTTFLKPSGFDSKLTQLTVKLPTGVVSGNLQVQTSFVNMAGSNVENRSTSIAYKVKPVVTSIEWSKRGFEQVGDKLRIRGRGITNSPSVNFYDAAGALIASSKATVLSVGGSEEEIEVAAPTKANQATVKVSVDGVLSDEGVALQYSARPKLTSITTKNKRTYPDSGEVLPAAKIGEEITLTGEGFTAASGTVVEVEFQGFGRRFRLPVESGKIGSTGKTIKITVPETAQTGFIAVYVSGERSNYRPVEIIPKLISVSPNPIVPASAITITARGVGGNAKAARIIFNLTSKDALEVIPDSISVDTNTGIATISLTAPSALSSSYSSINLRYDRWSDDEKTSLAVDPFINEASIDLDTKILTIKGYGFSINPGENQITYRYADENHTVISPSVKMIGVYPTEEGQEIRIQILDGYHYGYVSVAVGGKTSNEANFGPVSIRRIVRRVEMVESLGRTMGVLYISGYNFGTQGDVRVGDVWATTLYRSEFVITAAVETADLYKNPVIVTKL
jgi:hypothetical protein